LELEVQTKKKLHQQKEKARKILPSQSTFFDHPRVMIFNGPFEAAKPLQASASKADAEWPPGRP
jgi:hypothetical protein